MARRSSARHARPTRRGAVAAAFAALEADARRLRTATYADHLELIRLSSLVDALVAQVQRLGLELAEMRRELQAARSAPVPHDPHVDVLAAEVSELRGTVATQQAMLSDLTRRLLDLLERLEAPAVVPAAAPVVPAPLVSPVAQPVAPAAPEPVPVPASAYPAAAAAVTAPVPAAVRDAEYTSLRSEQLVSAGAHGSQSGVDDALDDETVLRLRLIRESFGR